MYGLMDLRLSLHQVTDNALLGIMFTLEAIVLCLVPKILFYRISGLSHGVKIYTKSDDYSGKFLTNPTVPEEYTSKKTGSVILGKHAIIGSNSIVLPGVTIGEGTAVGALSLVTKSLGEWGVFFG